MTLADTTKSSPPHVSRAVGISTTRVPSSCAFGPAREDRLRATARFILQEHIQVWNLDRTLSFPMPPDRVLEGREGALWSVGFDAGGRTSPQAQRAGHRPLGWLNARPTDDTPRRHGPDSQRLLQPGRWPARGLCLRCPDNRLGPCRRPQGPARNEPRLASLTHSSRRHDRTRLRLPPKNTSAIYLHILPMPAQCELQGERQHGSSSTPEKSLKSTSFQSQPNTRQMADAPDSKSGPRKQGVGSGSTLGTK